MARRWTCGFETQSVTAGIEFDSVVGSPTISTTTVRTGAAALRINPTAASHYVGCTFLAAASANNRYLRFYINIASAPSANAVAIAVLRSAASGNVITIRMNTNRTIELWDEQAAAKRGSASAVLNTGTWYRVELEYLSAGTCTAYLDGTSFATGVATASLDATIARIGAIDAFTADLFFDDVAVNDSSGSNQTGLPGDGAVIRLSPDSAGDANTFATQTGGTAGAGNNYTRVNETTPDDATTFNGSSTLNQEDMFNVGASGIGASDVVNVVEVWGRFRNSASDTTGAAKVQVKKTASGTVTQGAAIIPNSTTWRTNVISTTLPKPPLVTYTDPDGAAWTQTTLDSMQIGYKLTTGPGTAGRRIDFTSVWAYVDYTVSTGVTLTKTQSATARIAKNITKTQTATARVANIKTKTQTATARIANNAPTVALNTPADAATQGTTPTLNFTGTDVDGDTIEYEVQVDTSNTFTGSGSTIALDNSATPSTGGSGTNTISYTITSNTQGLLVFLMRHASVSTPTGVTYNGVALTKAVAGNTIDSIWYLVAPASGTHNLVVTLNGSTVSSTGRILSFTGVDQTTPINTAARIDTGVAGTSASQSITMARSGSAVIDFLDVLDGDGSTTPSASSGQTTTAAGGTTGSSGIMGYKLSAATGSYGYTWTGSNTFVYSTLSINPASATLLDKLSTADTGFTAGHPFASGAAKNFTVQAGDALTSGITYYWRVRAIDPSGSNTYGAWSSTRSFTVSSGSILTKTQTAVARIANALTKTQSAVARIQQIRTKTQSATARIQRQLTKTQSATARIATTKTFTQSATARIATAVTKTQTSTARIQRVLTKTQPSTARIQQPVSKTQSATARIGTTGAKTQTATARIQRVLTFTQGSTARIATARTKTQGAIARIAITGAKTQPATARIAATSTKIQPATARIQRVLTKAQASTGRIANTVTKTQSATASISSSSARTKAQTAIARIASNVTITQPAIARIAITGSKTQGAQARIAITKTKTQTAAARLALIQTTTQSATAHIVQSSVIKRSPITVIVQQPSLAVVTVQRSTTSVTAAPPTIHRVSVSAPPLVTVIVKQQPASPVQVKRPATAVVPVSPAPITVQLVV